MVKFVWVDVPGIEVQVGVGDERGTTVVVVVAVLVGWGSVVIVVVVVCWMIVVRVEMRVRVEMLDAGPEHDGRG